MFDIKTNVKEPKRRIKPEMLVKFNPAFYGPDVRDDIGLVVQVTKRLVHVLWLINSQPGSYDLKGAECIEVTDQERDTFFRTRGQHHYITEEKHGDLVPAPVGTEVIIRQIEV